MTNRNLTAAANLPTAATPVYAELRSWLDWLDTVRDLCQAEVPAELAETLEAALAQAVSRLRPAPPEILLTLVEQLSRYADDFQLKAPPAKDEVAWARIGQVYLEVFEDVPADLAEEAFRRWRGRGHSFGKLPEPAAVREQIEDEIAKRRIVVLRIEAARVLRRVRGVKEAAA